MMNLVFRFVCGRFEGNPSLYAAEKSTWYRHFSAFCLGDIGGDARSRYLQFES